MNDRIGLQHWAREGIAGMCHVMSVHVRVRSAAALFSWSPNVNGVLQSIPYTLINDFLLFFPFLNLTFGDV